MAAQPDLIVLGGDYVTWGDRQFVGPSAEALAALYAPHGVFGILGNHDDDHDMPAALAARGIADAERRAHRLADQTARRSSWPGIRFWTQAGRRHRAARSAARTGPVVLLAHDPRRLTEAAALNIPLVLSGHTHGGQVVLPAIGAIAAQKFPVVAGFGRQRATPRCSSAAAWERCTCRSAINCPPEVARDLTRRSLSAADRAATRLRLRRRIGGLRCATRHRAPAESPRDRAGAPRPGSAPPASRPCRRQQPAPPPAARSARHRARHVTRCTVAPLTRTPWASACRCASRPGKRRQQRRVDVQDAIRKRVEQRLPQPAA